MANSENLERWTSTRLTKLVGGTTYKWWLTTAIPMLVAQGVLVKQGRGWIGNRERICSALMAPKDG